MKLKSTGRLFVFGCSFTKYYWPTWADIIGQEFEYYENWGEIGSGNLRIAHRITECVYKNQIRCFLYQYKGSYFYLVRFVISFQKYHILQSY